jgi:ribonuclease BN (tRNA processing enzyme)
MMKIKVLGSRGEIKLAAPQYENHSGVLVDDTILFDLGEKSYLDYHPEHIFITHLHPDHAYFVRASEAIDFMAFAPETYKKSPNVNVIDKEMTVGPYRITPIPTHHSKLVISHAYILEKGDEKIIYTGDVVWVDKEYRSHFTGLDLAITDGSHLRKGGMVRKDKETGILFGHTGIPDLVRIFGEYTQNVLFVHLGNWFVRDPIKGRENLEALGKESGMKIMAGYDGMEIDLDGPIAKVIR